MDEILIGEHGGQYCAFARRPIRVVDWNIERGLKLAGVMEFLERQQPDLCILQEVDLNAKRTGRRDLAHDLAARFGFNYVFGIEFEELSQGSPAERAFSGQAVLARCRIGRPRILRFSAQSGIWRPRWFLPHWPVFQPRRGGRMALVVEMPAGPRPLVVYDLHLESQADENVRLWQLSEVVQDAGQYPLDTPVIVAGDMNTRESPSLLSEYLLTAGFQDAGEGSPRRGTKPNGKTLDWIFIRGPVVCTETKIHQDVRVSDHYPLSTKLTLTGKAAYWRMQ